jgi:hypothetical protein
MPEGTGRVTFASSNTWSSEWCSSAGRTKSATDELPRTIGRRSAAPLAFHGEIVTIRGAQSRYAAWVLAAMGSRRVLTAEKLAVDFKTLAQLLKAEPEQEGHDS